MPELYNPFVKDKKSTNPDLCKIFQTVDRLINYWRLNHLIAFFRKIFFIKSKKRFFEVKFKFVV